ncbi:MAG: hypothetical protein E8D52_07535 [Nitrospira sp.]|nr:MAG: hypothetical protein E8D52_07535 [Nitrospira sp.]
MHAHLLCAPADEMVVPYGNDPGEDVTFLADLPHGIEGFQPDQIVVADLGWALGYLLQAGDRLCGDGTSRITAGGQRALEVRQLQKLLCFFLNIDVPAPVSAVSGKGIDGSMAVETARFLKDRGESFEGLHRANFLRGAQGARIPCAMGHLWPHGEKDDADNRQQEDGDDDARHLCEPYHVVTSQARNGRHASPGVWVLQVSLREYLPFTDSMGVAIQPCSCVQSRRFSCEVSMRYLAFPLLLLLPLSAYAGNIKDTDLISSNNFFLPPSTQKTVFIQARNSSDNQEVSLHDLGARLSAKGYQIVNDPDGAHYVLLANIVYCNITKPDMPVEAMVSSGYGSAFNSTLGAMQGLTSMASMAGPYGAIGGAAASMGLSAIQGIGDLFSSSSSAPKMPDDVNYACVADVQITEQKTVQLPSGMKTGTGQEPGVYQTRLAADVHQKKLKEAEATPLLQQKLSAAVAGNF